MKNIFILLIASLLIIACLWFFTQKETKEELASHYKISKPTLQKWVFYFQDKFSIETWKKLRKITKYESSLLKHQWGDDCKMVLNKSQIADLASTDYKTLSKYVKENLEKINISEEAWEKCSVFPPIISQRIINILIGEPEPTLHERLQIAIS